MGKRIVNPNLTYLVKSRHEGKRGVVLEGSSRSGKTWSSIDFLIFLCTRVYKSATIHIIKETHAEYKTTLFEDFDRRFPYHNLTSPTLGKKDMSSFFLFGNRISLIGADKIKEGSGSDVFYINEAMPIKQEIFDSYEQRCRGFWWMDYNPKYTQHWIYDSVCKRPDVGFLRTTFLDNPFISEPEKRKILSYEPTHPEDRDRPENERRPHPINIEAGTASEYKWNVYGLGLRAAPEGIIYQYVTYIDKFPKYEKVDRVGYGLDFGYTNSPSAFCKVGVDIKRKRIYLQNLLYAPTESSKQLVPILDSIMETERKSGVSNARIWADSADAGMISKIRAAKHSIFPVKKYPGSVVDGIDTMKGFSIFIVKDADFQREQENYKWKVINGIKINEPEDEFNHLWDAARYYVHTELRRL